MKSHLKFSLVVGVLTLRLIFAGTANADDDSDINAITTTGKPGMQSQALSSLSVQDKMKFMKARRQVFASNPDLKAEQDSLNKQREALKDKGSSASMEDKKALLQNFMEHQKKMKTAMLQVDSSLGPVFDKIEAEMKKKIAEKAGNK
jgi:septation ring formation regulator EzrA